MTEASEFVTETSPHNGEVNLSHNELVVCDEFILARLVRLSICLSICLSVTLVIHS